MGDPACFWYESADPMGFLGDVIVGWRIRLSVNSQMRRCPVPFALPARLGIEDSTAWKDIVSAASCVNRKRTGN
jgi:hypothetical protein